MRENERDNERERINERERERENNIDIKDTKMKDIMKERDSEKKVFTMEEK